MFGWGIISFSFFIVVATTFDHGGLFTLVSLIFCGGIGFLVYSTKKPKRYWLLLSPLVVVLSLGFFQWRHTPPPFSENETTSFVGTGMIVGALRNQRYELNEGGTKSLVRIDKELRLGDVVYIVGREEDTLPSSFFTILRRPLIIPQIFQGKFDYSVWLRMKGWGKSISAKQVIVQGHIDSGGIVSTRGRLVERIRSLYKESAVASLLSGLLIGDVSRMTKDQYQGFIDAGLVHIVAVSGANMIMLIVFLHALLFFLPYYMRIGAISIILIWYAWLCGLDSSVMRALVMGLLTMLALLGGRVVHIWRLLGYTYVAMLVWNPYMLIYDLGFSLSFMALLGIIYMHELVLPRVMKLPRLFRSLVRNYILPTFGASLGVLPILLFFIGSTNISTLLANIFVLPLIPRVMMGGLVSLWLPGWSILSGSIIGSIHYIYSVAFYTTSWGIYVSSGSLLTKYVVLVGLLLAYTVFIWLVRIYRQEEDKLSGK